MNYAQEVILDHAAHAPAVGDARLSDALNDILTFAHDATLPTIYAGEEAKQAWFEMLDKDGLEAKVGTLADTWAQSESNIKHASKAVGRIAKGPDPPAVKGFAFCRFRAAATWYWLKEGPGLDESEQTVVFIALDDLGPNNGFPFPLARGQYVCMDGKTSFWTPPTGGGRAIFFSLEL